MIRSLLRILIAVLVLLSFLFPAYHYAALPEQIPIHFNAEGIADGFGNKSTVWLLPILNVFNLLLIFALTQAAKFMPAKKKKPPLFAEIVGLYVMLITTYIGIASVLVALEKMKSLGVWLLPIVLILTALLVVYLMFQQRKMKKKKVEN